MTLNHLKLSAFCNISGSFIANCVNLKFCVVTLSWGVSEHSVDKTSLCRKDMTLTSYTHLMQQFICYYK